MTNDYSMIRVKVPAGEILPQQLEKIAYLSETYSIGSAHFSTRENVQLHWVVLEDISEIMRGLAEVGMTSREACGNTVRNVMCAPLAGVCRDEAFDATPYAQATGTFFLRNPMCQNLPRKFKFNFTCCEDHGMVRMVDVGLVPQTREINGVMQRGFMIFLGGGQGNKAFLGHQLEGFTPDEDLLYTALAVLSVFDRLGDRKKMARNRLRYLVSEMGWEKFRNLVLKERALARSNQSVLTQLDTDGTPRGIRTPMRIADEAPAAVPSGFARWSHTNTIPQKQDGYRSVFITLEAGDITAAQLRSVAALCRDYSGECKARTGFHQNVVIRYVKEDDLPAMYSRLLEAGLAKTGALTMATTVGCSGTTSCNLALTNSHRLAKEVQRKLLELGIDEDPDFSNSSIKISGCPNSCGLHWMATLGFYGGGSRAGSSMYPVYQMLVGGRFDGHSSLGIPILRIPAKRVIPAILKVIELFREHKKPSDTLKSWLHRLVSGNGDGTIDTLDALKEELSPLTVAPSIEVDPDFYKDYGNEDNYHTKTGRGECAS
ncbi:ferredoxin-sulfite/nitrite reductase [Cenarchaeum symbiosum A]|uniref:Ferredoxin-sulfite/nitrite reductase n=1 Tax=Cenarchaeum symbiosum (strain A) TaxID=414004 RepID=A0RUH9_CENSY|nr:ferredoxin-sulfite/nitrite reductase [Cenarchaeum symbiosum A]